MNTTHEASIQLFFEDKYASSNIIAMMDMVSLACLSLSYSLAPVHLSHIDWMDLYKRYWCPDDDVMKYVISHGLEWPSFNTTKETNIFWHHMCVRSCSPGYTHWNNFTHHFEIVVGLHTRSPAPMTTRMSAMIKRALDTPMKQQSNAHILTFLLGRPHNCDLSMLASSAVITANIETLRVLYSKTVFNSSDCVVMFKRFPVADVLYIVREQLDDANLNAALITKKTLFVQEGTSDRRIGCWSLSKGGCFNGVTSMTTSMLSALVEKDHPNRYDTSKFLPFAVTQPWCKPAHIDIIVKNGCDTNHLVEAIRCAKSRPCKVHLEKYHWGILHSANASRHG